VLKEKSVKGPLSIGKGADNCDCEPKTKKKRGGLRYGERTKNERRCKRVEVVLLFRGGGRGGKRNQGTEKTKKKKKKKNEERKGTWSTTRGGGRRSARRVAKLYGPGLMTGGKNPIKS